MTDQIPVNQTKLTHNKTDTSPHEKQQRNHSDHQQNKTDHDKTENQQGSSRNGGWWSKAKNTVTSVLGKKDRPTKLEGGGRDWLVHASTGEISAKHDPSFFLARSPSPLLLVSHDSKDALVFVDLTNQEEQLFKTKDNQYVGLSQKVKKTKGYQYYDTVVSAYIEPLPFVYINSTFIVTNDDFVLDVALWKIVENQNVNFVKASDGSTYTAGGGRDFLLNSDGTISPKLNPSLVLGVGSQDLVVSKKEGPRIKLQHSQELADGKIISMDMEGGGVIASKEEEIADGWRVRQSVLAVEGAMKIFYDGNFLLTSDGSYALDISYWRMEEGNVVNFVGGESEQEDINLDEASSSESASDGISTGNDP